MAGGRGSRRSITRKYQLRSLTENTTKPLFLEENVPVLYKDDGTNACSEDELPVSNNLFAGNNRDNAPKKKSSHLSENMETEPQVDDFKSKKRPVVKKGPFDRDFSSVLCTKSHSAKLLIPSSDQPDVSVLQNPCRIDESSDQAAISHCYLLRGININGRGIKSCEDSFATNAKSDLPPLSGSSELQKYPFKDAFNAARRGPAVNVPNCLRTHAHNVIVESGFLVVTHKRKERKTIHLVYKEDIEGPIIRSLSKSWKKCGERLSSIVSNNIPEEDSSREWVDIDTFWFNLAHTLEYIEKKIEQQNESLSLMERWQMLNPFVTVLLISHRITALRNGKGVRFVNGQTVLFECNKSHSMRNVSLNPPALQSNGDENISPWGKISPVNSHSDDMDTFHHNDAVMGLDDCTLIGDEEVSSLKMTSETLPIPLPLDSNHINHSCGLNGVTHIRKLARSIGNRFFSVRLNGVKRKPFIVHHTKTKISSPTRMNFSGKNIYLSRGSCRSRFRKKCQTQIPDGGFLSKRTRNCRIQKVVMKSDKKKKSLKAPEVLRHLSIWIQSESLLSKKRKHDRREEDNMISSFRLVDLDETEEDRTQLFNSVKSASKGNNLDENVASPCIGEIPEKTLSEDATVRTSDLIGESNDIVNEPEKIDGEDDFLISVLLKSEDLGSKYPMSKGKKRSKLLLQTVGKSRKYSMKGRRSVTEARSVLAWLINSAAIPPNDTIQCLNLEMNTVLKDGQVRHNEIICKCCHKIHSVSEFKLHASPHPSKSNVFLTSGGSYGMCQLQAWFAEYESRKGVKQVVEDKEHDQNDDICGLCGEPGDLICCDSCPSVFHQKCLPAQEFPDGSWYCQTCSCRICADTAVYAQENSNSLAVLKCLQCQNKFHKACLKEEDKDVNVDPGSWFCSRSCQEIYSAFNSGLGVLNPIVDGLFWTILRCSHGDQKKLQSTTKITLKLECNIKLAIALSIMEEYFDPMVDPRTGIDMIPHLIYNWRSNSPRLDFEPFYTIILEKADQVISVASIRVHGARIAEIPLIATCSKHCRQGMCRRLMNSIEEFLKSLKVGMLVLSAIPSLVDTWKSGFGFEIIKDEEDKKQLENFNFMLLPGTIRMKKILYKEQSYVGAIVTPNFCYKTLHTYEN